MAEKEKAVSQAPETPPTLAQRLASGFKAWWDGQRSVWRIQRALWAERLDVWRARRANGRAETEPDSAAEVLRPLPSPLTLAMLQQYVADDERKWKRKEYFLKLIEEIGELSVTIKRKQRRSPDDDDPDGIKGTLEEELADVLYYIVALANAYGVDLEDAFQHKQAYTKRRK